MRRRLGASRRLIATVWKLLDGVLNSLHKRSSLWVGVQIRHAAKGRLGRLDNQIRLAPLVDCFLDQLL
jgi:hypothetical protein